MKYIFLSCLISVVAFIVIKYGFSSNNFSNTRSVADVYHQYPVDLVDFKLTLIDYVEHVCEKNEAKLESYNDDVSECINSHRESKKSCTVKVFRLAPMKLQTRDELIQYWQEYKECTLPYANIMG